MVLVSFDERTHTRTITYLHYVGPKNTEKLVDGNNNDNHSDYWKSVTIY